MSVEQWTLDALVEAYRQHQLRTRGLRERTLDGYERLVRMFIGTVRQIGSTPERSRCSSMNTFTSGRSASSSVAKNTETPFEIS
jgi:hypothetical protein